ncbi:unnamed protein product [Brassicogethes aeneus]|uniref:Uncharacterized protein n=1 Tax=Brassicogethes aeneus TaxID=1431903 RepID=A0A9P0AQ13_BRAAE|nr:unnamed protein product [Brassicogethes aeneus]
MLVNNTLHLFYVITAYKCSVFLNMMFLSRCEEQGHELKEAKRRNEELKNKEKALLLHRDEIEDRIKSNSIRAADVNTNLQVLFNEVIKQRKINSQNARALEAAKEVDLFVTSSSDNMQLSCMSSMNELNSISERLSIKEHIKLLEELTEHRLKIAEQNEIIHKLKQEQNHLQRDINDIKDPTTARHFQEEYIEFKLREDKVLREFKTVKQDISNLKNEMNLLVSFLLI